MIDLHFHCLPGIDDGPDDIESAVALCRAAAAEGTHTVIATPHVRPDQWSSDGPAQRDEIVARLNGQLAGTPSVIAGAEVWFQNELVELASMLDGPLPTLGSSRYMLIELPPTAIPSQLTGVMHELIIAGIVPVLAHPERNYPLMRQMPTIERLIELGVKMQITAGSIVGDFGDLTRRMCSELFERRMVHLVGSDAHGIDIRPPRMAAARAAVEREWGAEVAELLFVVNPRMIIEDREGIEAG